MIDFAVITEPRSGNQLLAHGLNQHPRIAVCRDLLCGGHLYADHLDVFERWVHSRRKNKKKPATSFGFFVYRSAYQDVSILARRVVEKHSRYILFRRKNMLRQFLSTKIATQYDRWACMERRKIRPKPIEINFSEFWSFVAKQTQDRSSWDQAIPRENMILYYEDLAKDWKPAMQAVQRYVGVWPTVVKKLTIRQETRPLLDIVSNFDTLVTELQQHGHDAWLD